VALAFAASAQAQTGGAAPPPDPSAPTLAPAPTGPPGRATLLPGGRAIAPAGAPAAVVNAINAGNQIRKRPYVWGGGHGSFFSRGYDCSGSVSYVLHAAGYLSSPLPSGPLMSWGSPGLGSWISVFANRGHVFMTVAGLRFDTSSAGDPVRRRGTGPRWRSTIRPATGYVVRHIAGL
jgi:hypothetical protein